MKVWAIITNSPRISEPEVVELDYHSSDGTTARVSVDGGPKFNYLDGYVYRTKEQAIAAWTAIHKKQYKRNRKKETVNEKVSNRTKN